MRDNTVPYVMDVVGRSVVIHDCEIDYVFLASILVNIVRAFKATRKGILKKFVFYGTFSIDSSIKFFFKSV